VIRARYRTLDGDEIELPLPMERWVLVPRALARFDPELAWTLDYDDAPAPENADPRLDFSAGALLVPVERWKRARLEPNLAPCRIDAPVAGTIAYPRPGRDSPLLRSGRTKTSGSAAAPAPAASSLARRPPRSPRWPSATSARWPCGCGAFATTSAGLRSARACWRSALRCCWPGSPGWRAPCPE
jgi:hypothetical protein